MAGPKRPVRNYWGAQQVGGRLRLFGQTVICGKSKSFFSARSFFSVVPQVRDEYVKFSSPRSALPSLPAERRASATVAGRAVLGQWTRACTTLHLASSSRSRSTLRRRRSSSFRSASWREARWSFPWCTRLAARNPRRPCCCPQARTRKTSERCLRPLVRARMHAYASPPSPHEARPRACLSCAGPAAGPGRVRRALPQPNRLVLLVPSEGLLRALRRPDALSRRSEAQKAAAAAAAAEVSSRGGGGGGPADRGGGAVCSGGARSRHADAEGAVAGDGRRSLAPAGASTLARRGD